MTKKTKIAVLSFVVITPFSLAVLENKATFEVKAASETIEDDLDNLDKVQDAYSVAMQSSDVGFGMDNRYISTYTATSAPTAETMWENYGYLQYKVSGQNLLTIIADESTSCNAPLVYASSSGLLTCAKNETTPSSNWTRQTYMYVLPENNEWLRIIPVSYNTPDESMCYWSQQITKVTIKEVPETELPGKEEPISPSVDTIVDELDNFDKTQDHYQVSFQSSDVGFGQDSRCITTLSPTEPANETNWWNENYAYLQYDVTGKNIIKVCVDTDPTILNVLPHIGVVANYGGSNNEFLDVNNYEIETSSNWTRITYTFVLKDNANWARLVFSVYNSYNSKLQTWMQQITSVSLGYEETLPEKGEIPTIEIIKKPEVSEVKTIEDDCDTLEGNANFSDFYRVDATNGKLVSLAEATQEYTDLTWWEGTNGYVQLPLNGQNLLTLDVLVEENVANYINPIGVFAGEGNALKKVEINNIIKGEVVEGWVNYKYVYILNAQTTARLVFSSYNSPDGFINSTSQQINHIKAEYVEEDSLPVADVVDTSHDTFKKEIDDYVATFNSNEYSKTNWDYIVYYANKAKHELNLALDDDTVIVNQAKDSINKVKTIIEEANEEKAKILEEFNVFFNDLDQTKYTEENWQKIAKYYNDAIVEIESISDLEQVKQIISDTKDDILNVKEIEVNPDPIPSDSSISEPETSETTSSSNSEVPSSNSSDSSNQANNNKKGCKGSTSSMGILALFALMGVSLKKKTKLEK